MATAGRMASEGRRFTRTKPPRQFRITALMGFHSVMERPDSVNRVMRR
jgi:hypothetical protein